MNVDNTHTHLPSFEADLDLGEGPSWMGEYMKGLAVREDSLADLRLIGCRCGGRRIGLNILSTRRSFITCQWSVLHVTPETNHNNYKLVDTHMTLVFILLPSLSR